jgi:hypothetical protein
MAAPKAEVKKKTLFEQLQEDVKAPEPLVVTDDITLYCPTKKQLEESQKQTSEEDSNRILIGEHYDALLALFENEPPHRWAEFNKIYLNHFFDVTPE